jgi:hypothetical protein
MWVSFGRHRSAVHYGICLLECIETNYATQKRTAACGMAPERGVPQSRQAGRGPEVGWARTKVWGRSREVESLSPTRNDRVTHPGACLLSHRGRRGLRIVAPVD